MKYYYKANSDFKFELLPISTPISNITCSKKFVFITGDDFYIYCFNPKEHYTTAKDIYEAIENEKKIGLHAVIEIKPPQYPEFIVFGDIHGDLALTAVATALIKKYTKAMVIDLGDTTTYHRHCKEDGDELHINRNYGYMITKNKENEIRKNTINDMMKECKYIKIWGNHDKEDKDNVMLIAKNNTRQLIFSHAIIAEQYTIDSVHRVYQKVTCSRYVMKKLDYGKFKDYKLEMWKKDRITYIDYHYAQAKKDYLPIEKRKQIERRYRQYVGKVENYNPTFICGHQELYAALPAFYTNEFPIKRIYIDKINIAHITKYKPGSIFNNLICVDGLM